MRLLKWIYEKIHKKPAPYYYNYSLITVFTKPLRKWLTNVVAANCPFNVVRILIYRLCGFKIGKNTFIGMRCYLDDMCYKNLIIGNNVTISYGVYFTCHSPFQKRANIVIKDGAYIGMRANILSRNSDPEFLNTGVVIGEKSIVGACSLVNKNVPEDATAVGVPCRIILSHNKNKHDD